MNTWEQTINYRCVLNATGQYYITGLYSDYDARTADRKWRVECCKSKGKYSSEGGWWCGVRAGIILIRGRVVVWRKSRDK